MSVPRAVAPSVRGVSPGCWERTYQTEGPQHRQAALLGRAQLHQAHGDDDAVKDVPSLLEVIVGVEGNDFEDHFGSEEHSKDLWLETRVHQGLWGQGIMANRATGKRLV